jgi:hypothetical protein
MIGKLKSSIRVWEVFRNLVKKNIQDYDLVLSQAKFT